MTCSKCDGEMAYIETRYFPISHYSDGWVDGGDNRERCDIWRCPKCGKLAFYKGLLQNTFSSECLHCGLELKPQKESGVM